MQYGKSINEPKTRNPNLKTLNLDAGGAPENPARGGGAGDCRRGGGVARWRVQPVARAGGAARRAVAANRREFCQ